MLNYLNYIIEVNLGLCLLAIFYVAFLRNETAFTLKRFFLLGGIFCSLTFPLMQFHTDEVYLPTVAELIPTVWLPEVIIGDQIVQETSSKRIAFADYIQLTYLLGLILFLFRFIFQTVRLVYLLNEVRPVKTGRYYLADTDRNLPSFSFFNIIVIGKSAGLREREREQIIRHEQIHAGSLHSFDILLVSILQIFFWFNPLMVWLKKTFVQLHEFEADARSVKVHEVNEYCSLLAKVALLSADISFANHFSNSLTLKRIQMMRKIKSKIKRWKIYTLYLSVPFFFFVLSCNDQVAQEVSGIAQSAQMALNVPPDIQARYDLLSSENPSKKYVLLELNDEGSAKLEAFEKEYGLPTSMEVFKSGEPHYETTGEPTISAKGNIVIEKGTGSPADGAPTYVILTYDEQTKNISKFSQQQDGVFTVVEETASFPGGMQKLHEFLSNELRYPSQARIEKIEGKVLVEFIIETDGSISNIDIKKGVESSIDAEALRVIKMSPSWIPAKQSGKTVRQKLVLPIMFRLPKDETFKKTSSLDLIMPSIDLIRPRDSSKKESC